MRASHRGTRAGSTRPTRYRERRSHAFLTLHGSRECWLVTACCGVDRDRWDRVRWRHMKTSTFASILGISLLAAANASSAPPAAPQPEPHAVQLPLACYAGTTMFKMVSR